MPRPLLLLILLGLLAGGVALVMLAGDPPVGNGDPAARGSEETRPVVMTFILMEKQSRRPIAEASYKLQGPGLRQEADRVATPVTVAIQKPGNYTIQFQKRSFFGRSVGFAITRHSKRKHIDVLMTRDQGEVRVEVRDRATNTLVRGFKVRVIYRSGEHWKGLWIGPVQETHYDAQVHLDTDARIQVEAKGYAPSEEKSVKVTAFAPEQKLTFHVQRVMPFTGIELRVAAATLHPAKQVRVVAELKKHNDTYQEVWNRTASRDDGIYRLPDLKPGTYRLTVRALPAEDTLDTHVPFVKEIEFTGGERYELPVQLEAGARILLKVVDRQGKLVGQGVKVSLLTAAGKQVRTLWEHVDAAGKPLPFVAIGANGLVQDGAARLRDPVPVGHYRLKVQRGSADVRTVPVTLRAGATKKLRVNLSE
jgi:hypothetical protein